MKHTSVRLNLFLILGALVVLLCVPSTPSQAGTAELPIAVLSSGDDHLALEITTPPFRTEDIAEPDGTYRKILIDGWPLSPEAGNPALPRTGMLIPVPPAGTMTLEVVPGIPRRFDGCRVWPLPPRNETEDTATRNESIYGESALYPALDSLVHLGPRQFIGTRAVARLTVTPFQWNPAEDLLYYYPRIGCTIRFNDTAPATLSDRGTKEIDGENEAILPSPGTALKTSAPSVPWTMEGVKMTVRRDGLYRVSYEELVTAGMDETLLGTGAFRLYRNGIEYALKIVSGNGEFGPGDYVEFYGEGLDTEFTDANVYWLTLHGSPGISVTPVDGSVTGNGVPADSFTDTLHVEENHTMWSRTPGAPDADYWFWEKLTAPARVTHSFTIPAPEVDGGDATIRLAFQGGSDTQDNPDHHVLVSLNGTEIGDTYWDGTAAQICEASLPSTLLREGANTLAIELPGDRSSVDIVYFNGLDIVYRRSLKAVDDALTFTVEGSGGTCEPTVTGLGDDDIVIYDITDPAAPREVTGFDVTGDGSSYSATFETVAGDARRYHVTTADRIGTPDALMFREPAHLANPDNGADYILITAEEFLPAVEPLCNLRRLQGLRVATVSVEAILDTFNGGILDPAALKAFLVFASENWQKPSPRYVFLVGDANLDYRDYYGSGKANRVPVHLTLTGDLGLTPSDNWYACVTGDDMLPDLAIGRIPGAHQDDVVRTVNKIIAYELSRDYEPREVLFVADDDYVDFEEINDYLASQLPPDFTATAVYARLYGEIGDATDDIIDRLNGGTLLTNYFGHGDVTRWGGGPAMTEDFIFESYDLNHLANAGRLTFVVALDCLNGYFGQPFIYSLGEAFVEAPEKGAIASFAPSALGYIWEQEIVDEEIFAKIFDGEENGLGTIATESKIAAYGRGVSGDIVEMFHLFGDPATTLALYDRGPAVETFTITAEAESHGTITPSGIVTVLAGADQTFTICPDSAFRIDTVTIDGTPFGPIDTYRFENIQSNHTIEATFADESPAGPGGGGGGGGGGCFIDSLSH